jgi:hypothetical protein
MAALLPVLVGVSAVSTLASIAALAFVLARR